MPLNETTAWLIAYDIADPGRLALVHKCVSRIAFPVQYSVYLGIGSQNQMNALCQELEKLIDPRLDDVRVYRIPDSPEFVACGEPRFDGQIVLPEAIAPGARNFISRLFQSTSGSTVHEPAEEQMPNVVPFPGASAGKPYNTQ